MKGTPKGGSRILKEVQNWRDFNIELSEDQMLNTGRNYCKIYVSPYSDLQLDNSPAPKPSGIIRQHILSGLIDIYKSWQKTLEQFDTPYYLKLWLYEERFEKSQVVCGIGPYVNFYDTTFQIAIENAKLTTGNFQNEHERLSQFSWQKAHDLEHHYATDIEEQEEYFAIVFENNFVPNIKNIDFLYNHPIEGLNKIINYSVVRLSSTKEERLVVLVESYNVENTLEAYLEQNKSINATELEEMVTSITAVLTNLQDARIFCCSIKYFKYFPLCI